MILNDGLVLDSVKFNVMLQDMYTNYQRSLPLRFLDRVNRVNADDDEITTTFTGRVFAAAVVADDQEAPVYEAGQLEYVTNVLPNIKIGKRFSQRLISRLNLIKRNLSSPGIQGERNMFLNWETQAVADLIRGVEEQMNALVCACYLDSLAYDSLGIKINGSWGTPSDLKATPSALWTDATNGDPYTDVMTMKLHAANTYGEVYNRLTMSTADFQNMVACAKFKNLLPTIFSAPLANTAFNAYDPRMQGYASELMKMEIVIEDKLIFQPLANGSWNSNRVMTLGKVIVDSTEDDKNNSAHDWANALVTEALVAGLVGDPDNVVGGSQFGPFGYYTGKPDLNPPNLTAWGVARGFPRKHRKTMNAILTVQ